MLVSQHASMHWRPDAITRTGVIEPMWIRQVSPVDMARHTIDPFIASVRGAGPAVSPYPAPEDIAYVAAKLAKAFAQGRGAIICLGAQKIAVYPNTPAAGGIVGTITAAAKKLSRGGTASIQVGSRRVIVCNSGPGGEPVITAAPSAPGAGSNTGPTQMQSRETPMPANGFGMPLLANTRLPQVPGPGHVPQYPFKDYAYYYRKLNYDDNVWGRRNFQASLAQRFAPNAMREMNAANRIPIRYAQTQARPPLDTRPPMIQQRYPRPEAVWPHQVRSRGAMMVARGGR